MQRLVTQQRPECKAVLQEVTQLVEEKLSSNSKALKTTFGATQLKIDGDFLYFLEEAASIVVLIALPTSFHALKPFKVPASGYSL
ncbi:unnamed protein product [Lactuca virosa]|uniref:Uncharacterized protein n=1 Tax=Lactuca virosa TaxID=75947 RepID=A0AAU9MA32_9ASTR|nr:unnamed protein product [Lactuca virosa]